MQHAFPLDTVRPWRTAAIVAAAVAALELVGLVAAGSVLLARSGAHAATTVRVKRTHRLAAKQLHAAPLMFSRARTPVLVLNGNGRAGAAASEARLARARGYPISAVGNAPTRTYGRSVVMYRRGFRREALRLRHDLGLALVGPLDGLRPSRLGRARVVVVIGA
ncbi:MAG: LytR C-terminal domain-containing protein [Gaiellaceae bacterium]